MMVMSLYLDASMTQMNEMSLPSLASIIETVTDLRYSKKLS